MMSHIFELVVFFLCLSTCLGQNYIAEGYFVVDDKAVQVYVNEIPGSGSYATKRAQAIENMRKDIDYTLSEANALMGSLSSVGLNLEIKLRDLKILNENIFPGEGIQNGLFLTSNTGLENFKDWLKETNAFNTLKYDFAILWTGFDLYGSSGRLTAGYAHVGKICDEKFNVGVVEFNATYGTALVTAHELGHLLGANHAGPASKTIMSALSSPRNANRWTFSSCAAQSMKDYINLLDPNCLLDTNPVSRSVTVPWSSYTGQMYDVDALCRRARNHSDSYACRAASLYNDAAPKGDIICQQIYCHKPGTNLCYTTYPSEGMICDRNKRCNDGKCQPDTSAASRDIDPNCLWGDERVLRFTNNDFRGSCDEFINLNGKGRCYNAVIEKLCCKTCKDLSSGKTVCKYGDKSTQCKDHPRSAVCPQYGDDICCEYCKDFKRKRSTDEDRQFDVVMIQDQAYGDIVEADEQSYSVEGEEFDEEDD